MTIYSPIAEFLETQPVDLLHLDFDEIERILGRPLPASAFKHQAWWANDPSHSQGKSWIAAGWKTESLDLAGRTVTFARSPGASKNAPASDPWGALAGTVTIHDEAALTSPGDEVWDAEADAA